MMKLDTLKPSVLAAIGAAFNATTVLSSALQKADEKKCGVADTLWPALGELEKDHGPKALDAFSAYCAAVELAAREKAQTGDMDKPPSLKAAIGESRARSWAATKSAIRRFYSDGFRPSSHASFTAARTARKAKQKATPRAPALKLNGALRAALDKVHAATVGANGLGDSAQVELAAILTDACKAFDGYMVKRTETPAQEGITTRAVNAA